MNVSKTDAAAIIRYLEGAAKFYSEHATSSRDVDRARLIRKLLTKIKRNNDKEKLSNTTSAAFLDFLP